MAAAPPTFWPASAQTPIPADYRLRIATGLVELAPQHVVSTTLYDGQFPGPLLRFKEGMQDSNHCGQRLRAIADSGSN